MKYKALVNKVLIRPSAEHGSVVMSDGTNFIIDTTFEKELHSVMSGTVVAEPQHLLYSNERHGEIDSVEFDSDIEIQPGDEVWFHHQAIAAAVDDHDIIEDGDSFIFACSYDQIYVRKRDEEITPVNGWVLVEPIEEEILTSAILLPDDMVGKASMKKGRVRYVGAPIRQYRDEQDFRDEEVEINAGDVVLFLPYSDIPVEYSLHASIDGKQEFFRMQRRDIVAVIEE